MRTYNELRTQQSSANLNTSVKRDAEDCYFVISLYSSFLKYLPFHISLYPHVFYFQF